ncbi:MAG: AlpA family phage regulatory protein [Deltaproteobacteria bacterium]
MDYKMRYLRIWDIVGDVKRGIPAIIPISKSAWWAGVKSGRYPKQVKLSQRCSGWRLEDIQAVCSQFKVV